MPGPVRRCLHGTFNCLGSRIHLDLASGGRDHCRIKYKQYNSHIFSILNIRQYNCKGHQWMRKRDFVWKLCSSCQPVTCSSRYHHRPCHSVSGTDRCCLLNTFNCLSNRIYLDIACRSNNHGGIKYKLNNGYLFSISVIRQYYGTGN